jgi:hypothetical protein
MTRMGWQNRCWNDPTRQLGCHVDILLVAIWQEWEDIKCWNDPTKQPICYVDILMVAIYLAYTFLGKIMHSEFLLNTIWSDRHNTTLVCVMHTNVSTSYAQSTWCVRLLFYAWLWYNRTKKYSIFYSNFLSMCFYDFCKAFLNTIS